MFICLIKIYGVKIHNFFYLFTDKPTNHCIELLGGYNKRFTSSDFQWPPVNDTMADTNQRQEPARVRHLFSRAARDAVPLGPDGRTPDRFWFSGKGGANCGNNVTFPQVNLQREGAKKRLKALRFGCAS